MPGGDLGVGDSGGLPVVEHLTRRESDVGPPGSTDEGMVRVEKWLGVKWSVRKTLQRIPGLE